MAIKNAQVAIGVGAQMEARPELRLSLIVSPELNDTLNELAERSHTTKSEVLRKAIALFDVAAEKGPTDWDSGSG